MSYRDIGWVRRYEGGASHQMAQYDSGSMEQYKPMIQRVGNSNGVDPALIAGIISRESSAGVTLQNGWGDHGKAWGLMQVDVHPQGGNHTRRGDWNSEEHLNQATGILVDSMKSIQQKFPTWDRELQLRGGLVAYNKGPDKVTSEIKDDVDAPSTHGNYSKDVVARAQWYKRNVYKGIKK
ncbi:lysozyme g-like [Cololabis saira]|uniref:lysozyme g-like n=1 Tax=Cololabis saira TaxID=129043 RepID=UPI002AD368AE|nr:lysozyme g-like [Cololabis saira]XP_061585216.1 lysozyme g-like [Cololabis saira]